MAAAPSSSSAKDTTSTRLVAVYSSPDGGKTFAHPLAPLPSSAATPLSTATKTQYMASLRQSIPKLQDEINEFLTDKMEQDKKAAGTHESDGAKANHEAKAEHDYGEEAADEAEEG